MSAQAPNQAGMTQDLLARLQILLDERDIREVLLRYCRGVDRCDAGLIASCYHEDSVDDHGNWYLDGPSVAGHVVGIVKPGTAVDTHFTGNILIDVQGDTAYAESYLLAFRDFERDGRSYTQTRSLRYVDRFERRDGQWRIGERAVADGWNRVDEVVQRQKDNDLYRRGTKDDQDMVYAIRRGPVARRPT